MRHFVNESFELFRFFDPLGDLRSQGFGDIESVRLLSLLPREEGGSMDRALLNAATLGIATALVGDGE